MITEINVNNSDILSNHSMKNIKAFLIGPDVYFDKVGIAMISRYSPVYIYIKENPENFHIDLFIMAESKYYFIYNFDVYQGKN